MTLRWVSGAIPDIATLVILWRKLMEYEIFFDLSKMGTDALSYEEERELLKNAKNGDNAALQKLLTSNIKFIHKKANYYHNRGLEHDDLIQEGAISLCIAARRFDMKRSDRFITYAQHWTRHEMGNAVNHTGNLIRFPENRTDLIGKFRITSLDAPLSKSDDNSLTLADTLEDDSFSIDTEIDQAELKREIKNALSKLPKNQRTAIELTHGLNNQKPLSLRKAGAIMGITAQQVLNLKNAGLKRLREPDISDRLDVYYMAA